MKSILAFFSIFVLSYTAQAAPTIPTIGVKCLVAENVDDNWEGQTYGDSIEDGDTFGIRAGKEHVVVFKWLSRQKVVTATVTALTDEPDRPTIREDIEYACDKHEESGNYELSYDDVLNGHFTHDGRKFGYSCTPICGK